MISIKTEKECVMELIKENRPIVELNLKMAKKHIKLKGIKKASKTKKASKIPSFLEIFMEEAYKQLRLDGLALAKEKMEIKNMSTTQDTNKSICEKDSKKEINTLKNSSKSNNENVKNTNDNSKNISTNIKPVEKTELKNNDKTNILNENNISKSDVTENSIYSNKDASLESLSRTNEKSTKDIVHKSKTLDCPPPKNDLPNTELVSPFTEVKRKDGSSQLGFSILTTGTPIEKTKRKRTKKKNTDINIFGEITSQLSLFGLI